MTGPTLAAALLFGTILGAPLGASAQAQTLTIGVRAGPDSIDPHWSTLGSQAETLRHIFDTVVMADENLQLKPGLATSWKPIDDTTWEFKIREGVKFHDGSELTAEDVKFSIDRIPAVTGPMSMTIYTKQVKDTKAVDKYTLHVTTKVPAPTLPNDFIRLFVVSKSIGADARNEQFNSGKAAIGTGPYKFVSWEPKGDFVVERFDGYWGEKQPWQKVVRKEIPNDPARMAALKSGQVDLVELRPGHRLRGDAEGQVARHLRGGFRLLSQRHAEREGDPAQAREGGRQGDCRQPPARPAGAGGHGPRHRPQDPGARGARRPRAPGQPADAGDASSAAARRLPERPYDVAKAKQLLADAGYPKGFEIDFALHQQPAAGRFGGVRGALADVGARRPQGQRERAQRHRVLPGAAEGRVLALDERLGHADGRGELHLRVAGAHRRSVHRPRARSTSRAIPTRRSTSCSRRAPAPWTIPSAAPCSRRPRTCP